MKESKKRTKKAPAIAPIHPRITVPPPHREPCGVCDSYQHCPHCAHDRIG
jgi:hypothetical protein